MKRYIRISSSDEMKIYNRPFKTTIDCKRRKFPYKIPNQIFRTNKILYKMKLAGSPLCSFCKDRGRSLSNFCYINALMRFDSGFQLRNGLALCLDITSTVLAKQTLFLDFGILVQKLRSSITSF